jgi:hypothetical protein
MRIEYSHELADYETLVIDMYRKARFWRWLAVYWFGTVAFVASGIYLFKIYDETENGNLGYVAAIQFCVALYLGWRAFQTPRRTARAQYAPFIRTNENFVLDLDDERLEFTGPHYFARLGWAKVTSYSESAGAFNIISNGVMYLVPKRFIPKEQQKELRDLIESHYSKNAGSS